ncbi:16S rRNA (cytosine(1402)-N(4))-methyltransferase RsmH [Patescibacteria group bacterium]|nr:16S rRNA (cytosine(1402)-N(4))-methyltransferase RsmH [Patescibacteria group bacterium]MBU4477293.1 16S rRNA (cytosine(1402)-N(4))-methyltransferase RsmH [Patescibacteria group bacterium]
MGHIPVLLKEAIQYLNAKDGDVILDSTVGGGGHAKAIMQKIGKTGTLVGIDQDAAMLDRLKSKFQIPNSKLILINGNFRDLDKLIAPHGFKKVNGAVFDLGINSEQFEESGRGFSFQKDEPLLMTYKSDIGPNDLTAKEIVNEWSEKEIADVIYKNGEERYSRRIARKIVERRKEKPIKTTSELVEIIRLSVPPAYRNNRRIHCATRTFQALRMAVNDELPALEEGIGKAWELLERGGRMVAISFHSLEDRIVKNFFRNKAKDGEGKVLTKKPIVASKKEKEENPRARSAKMRAIEKI